MKLVVGLGNPGREYQDTRHNVGFMVAEELARRLGLNWRNDGDMAFAKAFGEAPFIVAMPQTFMNRSGPAVQRFAAYYGIDPGDALVIVDDVDLPIARLRIRAQGSAGTHNGLRSVVQALGTTGFPRLRIGVGRGDKRRDLADYVLAEFDQEEWPQVRTAITRAADAAQMFTVEDIVKVMNVYNPDPTASETPD